LLIIRQAAGDIGGGISELVNSDNYSGLQDIKDHLEIALVQKAFEVYKGQDSDEKDPYGLYRIYRLANRHLAYTRDYAHRVLKPELTAPLIKAFGLTFQKEAEIIKKDTDSMHLQVLANSNMLWDDFLTIKNGIQELIPISYLRYAVAEFSQEGKNKKSLNALYDFVNRNIFNLSKFENVGNRDKNKILEFIHGEIDANPTIAYLRKHAKNGVAIVGADYESGTLHGEYLNYVARNILSPIEDGRFPNPSEVLDIFHSLSELLPFVYKYKGYGGKIPRGLFPRLIQDPISNSRLRLLYLRSIDNKMITLKPKYYLYLNFIKERVAGVIVSFIVDKENGLLSVSQKGPAGPYPLRVIEKENKNNSDRSKGIRAFLSINY